LHNCERFGQLQTVRSTETLKISHRLMNNSHFARCLQGGGVAVWEGSVSIVNSQIYSNTAHNVRVCVRNSHRPDGKLTVLLVVCRAAVFVSLEAQSHSSIAKCIPTKLHMCGDSCSKAPIAPMGELRPDGRLTICSLFAGRRCPCQWWHSVNRELPDLLQHSYLCTR
jgi:hypothetical protein